MLFSKKASRQTRRFGASSLCLTLAALGACLAPAAPAEASEVVKLARLVITGKRLSAMPQHRAVAEQLPRVVVQGQSEGQQSDKQVVLLRVPESRRAQFQPI
ncbi:MULTISPECIES: hypothetical protein [Roseateles]|uniref:TonB-dependent receptor n=1 Tax=Roseateles albus TaxID=2987525 RepID=A0ABT5KAT5_9BURK|nr:MULTISPECIES: hypothetical protein [Roseateles]MCV2357605.1 hypothetical protein [Paucibacter sp. TC2R-5]MDC8770674.1 hypothetical protein [Roseateles albus]